MYSATEAINGKRMVLQKVLHGSQARPIHPDAEKLLQPCGTNWAEVLQRLTC